MSKEDELLKNDYLWDGSGEPDAAVVRLERALGKFQHAGRAPELPDSFVAAHRSKGVLGGARLWFQFAAVGARVVGGVLGWGGERPRGGMWGGGGGGGGPRVSGGAGWGSRARGRRGENAKMRGF